MSLVEKAHAELSASGSERWINCSGSVALIREAPPQTESKYAAEGTLAHHYLEEWLMALWYGVTYAIPKELRANEDMLKAVKRAVDFITDTWDETSQKLLIEEKVSLEFIGPEMFGTLDIGLVELGEHLQVWDYKHGAGKVVDVVTESDFGRDLNTQLVYYALGLAHRYDYKFKKVTLGVIQPRAGAEWKRSVTVSMKELRKYEYVFSQAVKRVQGGKRAKLYVGPWCHWCPAKDFNCPKQENLRYEKRKDMFD